jgi:hypothetical protein
VSRVYFRSPSGCAELHGSERARLGGIANDIAIGALHLDDHHIIERLQQLIPDGHFMTRQHPRGPDWALTWADSFRTALLVNFGQTPLIAYRGQEVDAFDLVLNSALALGNDAVRLGVRIHGQCEIHGWVDGSNRAWLADIMQAGLDAGIYRHGFWREPLPGSTAPRQWLSQGWDEVIEFLRAQDDEPVVMSYSVTDGFPNEMVGDWMPPWPADVPKKLGWDGLSEEQQTERQTRADAWWELDDAEQWRISMAGLRQHGGGRELRPGNWQEFRFGHRLSVLDLVAQDWEDRLARALGLVATAS